MQETNSVRSYNGWHVQEPCTVVLCVTGTYILCTCIFIKRRYERACLYHSINLGGEDKIGANAGTTNVQLIKCPKLFVLEKVNLGK
jgi:hypothetical protein